MVLQLQRNATRPGFLHEDWGFELRSLCLCGKHYYPLSHLFSPSFFFFFKVKGDPKLLILQHLPLSAGVTGTSQHFYPVVRTGPRAPCTLRRYSANCPIEERRLPSGSAKGKSQQLYLQRTSMGSQSGDQGAQRRQLLQHKKTSLLGTLKTQS